MLLTFGAAQVARACVMRIFVVAILSVFFFFLIICAEVLFCVFADSMFEMETLKYSSFLCVFALFTTPRAQNL